MFGPLRKKRKIITGVALVTWLFALSAGIAHGCGWGDVARGSAPVVSDLRAPPHKGAALSHCEQFCKLDVPVVRNQLLADDHASIAPLMVAISAMDALPLTTQGPPRVGSAYLAPDAPRLLRSTHLRL